MAEGTRPIGFEGILSKERISPIGFEPFEDRINMPVYPSCDTMPGSTRIAANFDLSTSSSFGLSTTTSSLSYYSDDSHDRQDDSIKHFRKLQLSAIFHEISDGWCTIDWLHFDNGHKDPFLTLQYDGESIISIQTALDNCFLTTGRSLLCCQPECLLIRTDSNEKTVFIPNAKVSIGNLLNEQDKSTGKIVQYKLMAIICRTNESISKLMFYKDPKVKTWEIYYCNGQQSDWLSRECETQLESLIKKYTLDIHFDLSNFAPPLNALLNHPIFYVYIRKF